MFTAIALVLTSPARLIAAEGFLKARPEEVNKEDVRQLLLAELSGRVDSAKLQGIEAELSPLFDSLPKNHEGRLEAPLVRYALHRYFVQKNGWYVKGLDAVWSHNESSSHSTVMKARAPAYIQSLFEEQLQGRGFGRHQLTVFAATLADLIHAEAVGQLEQIHKAKELSTTGAVSRADADEAIEAFLIAYLLGGNTVAENAMDLLNMKSRLQQQYPDYPETQMWLQDFRMTYDLAQAPRRNPFVDREPTFEDSAAFVLDFSHHFGSFQNLECHGLKRRLTDMEHLGTGRVRLADFYSNALSGGWEFMESAQYLRNQGALDETDPNRPSVVIPNYLNSLANCLTASNFYAVCCVNECNALMSHLEQRVAQPTATPAQIAQVVSHLQSDTVDAPRNLSSALLGRLDEIAAYHGDGTVPLHGRLFAQWMHHAYPRECQFPHLSGSLAPLTPEEFARSQGIEALEATMDEMQAHAAWKNEISELQSLPWAHIEEELTVRERPSSPGRSRLGLLGSLAALAALGSFAVPLGRTVQAALAGPTKGKVDSHFV